VFARVRIVMSDVASPFFAAPLSRIVIRNTAEAHLSSPGGVTMPYANVGGIFRGLMSQASVTELSPEDVASESKLKIRFLNAVFWGSRSEGPISPCRSEAPSRDPPEVQQWRGRKSHAENFTPAKRHDSDQEEWPQATEVTGPPRVHFLTLNQRITHERSATP